MNRKPMLLVLSILLVLSLLLAGCSPFQRPAPEQQPAPAPAPAPGDPVAPENRQDPEDIQRPGQPAPRSQPGQQPGPDAMNLANRVADMATDVEGVDNAVVVVISNMAMIGITMEDNADGRETEVKEEVASVIEEREPSIVNAYVSADPDIVRQLEEISAGIERGEPISTFFDQITEVLQRMRAETTDN